ncbi:MAG TPA: GNAT family N-acetyltransferase, partial [Fimbriimonadaceae bacterium]
MLELRLLEYDDADAILQYYRRNIEHLRPWIPSLPLEFYTLQYQQRRLEAYVKLAAASEEFRFGVFDELRLVASINLTAIEYAAFQNGRLGYSVDGEYQGQGLATEYIGNVCDFCFQSLNLHRIEANVMPRNAGSKRVLE